MMYQKLQKLVDRSLNNIQSKIREHYSDPIEATKIYKQIVETLAKIKHDPSQYYGCLSYNEAIDIVDKILLINDDEDWADGLGDIGLTLDGRLPEFGDIVDEACTTQSEGTEFFISQTEEIYQLLIGIAGN